MKKLYWTLATLLIAVIAFSAGTQASVATDRTAMDEQYTMIGWTPPVKTPWPTTVPWPVRQTQTAVAKSTPVVPTATRPADTRTPAPTNTASVKSTATPAPTPNPNADCPRVWSGNAPVAPVELDPEERILLALINQCRALMGRPQMTFDIRLARAASVMSTDLMERNRNGDPSGQGLYCGHETRSGQTLPDRVWGAGYPQGNAMAEDVGCGYWTGEDMFRGWMDSPAHKSNMLFYYYVRIGIARVENLGPAGFPMYWTADFADCVTACP